MKTKTELVVKLKKRTLFGGFGNAPCQGQRKRDGETSEGNSQRHYRGIPRKKADEAGKISKSSGNLSMKGAPRPKEAGGPFGPARQRDLQRFAFAAVGGSHRAPDTVGGTAPLQLCSSFRICHKLMKYAKPTPLFAVASIDIIRNEANGTVKH